MLNVKVMIKLHQTDSSLQQLQNGQTEIYASKKRTQGLNSACILVSKEPSRKVRKILLLLSKFTGPIATRIVLLWCLNIYSVAHAKGLSNWFCPSVSCQFVSPVKNF